MIDSFEFPSESLQSSFTAKKVRIHFSEEEKIKLTEVITEINGYLKNPAHLCTDHWKFDVEDCTRKTRKRLVKAFEKDSFKAIQDKYNDIIILSASEKTSKLEEKIKSVALKRFSDLCKEIPEAIFKNSNAVIWHCIIYDTSEKIIDEIRKQILEGDRGFQVIKHQQVEEACGKRFVRTKQMLEIRDPSQKPDDAWEGAEVTLEF